MVPAARSVDLTLSHADTSKDISAYIISIEPCVETLGSATRSAPKWTIKSQPGAPRLRRISYGETPNGWSVLTAAVPLEPGCYAVVNQAMESRSVSYFEMNRAGEVIRISEAMARRIAQDR
jgi:hypothetical protein